MDFRRRATDNRAMRSLLTGTAPRVAALALLLVAAGCADRTEGLNARLDRIEARLDRLDDRLARTESRVDATPRDGGTAANDVLGSLLTNMDPERRAQLQRRAAELRERMAQLREGADINAKPGTPEFRRGLVLEMLRGGGLGRRGLNPEPDAADPDADAAAPTDPTGE
jgi:hypothetical protein